MVINYIVNVIGADKDMGYYHCLCMTLRLLTSWHTIMRQPFSAAIKIWIYYDSNHTFNQKCVLYMIINVEQRTIKSNLNIL